jgi:prepilin signal peptidase PulO-like enzyme (type II secretory pathway)
MGFFTYFIILILGLVIGSFLNCVIFRIEKKESFLSGRSYCPHCHHTLGFSDLIPVLSFLFLKGECSYCKKKISLQYPLVELSAGLLFLLIFHFYQFSFQSLLLFAISAILLIIFTYDFKHYLIPDKATYSAIVLAAVFSFFFGQYQFLNYLASAALVSGIFLFLVLVSKEKWMGMGDAKLVFLMGILLGWPNILVAVFLAAFLGSAIGLILVALNKKKIKSEVPFGPFLVFGTFISLFWSEEIINWYFDLLF